MASSSFNMNPVRNEEINTKYRRIKTALPVPESIPELEKLWRQESRSMHGAYPMVWDKAYGSQVYDPWGNMWLDFTSTIFVANAGHGNDRIRAALLATIDKPLLHTYNYANPERLSYLNYLTSVLPPYLEKIFLLSAGTEATEVALKLMRLKGKTKNNRKLGILCFEGNWHGRTLGAQMMSGNLSQKEWIGYTDPNIHHCPFPHPWDSGVSGETSNALDIEKFLHDKNIDPQTELAGVMLETYQGWCASFYPKGFVQELAAFCKKNDIALAFDEMQAGFGRTGKLFGYMHYDVEPDIVCCGKGASSSLPLSLVLGKKDFLDMPDVGSMSSTHSANPLTCAAGEANLRALVDDGLIENCDKLSQTFFEHLNETRISSNGSISFVLGKGLVAGVIFGDPNTNDKKAIDNCNRIAELCFQRGLLVVHTGRESIKVAPTLNITEEALIEGLNVFRQCVNDVIV